MPNIPLDRVGFTARFSAPLFGPFAARMFAPASCLHDRGFNPTYSGEPFGPFAARTFIPDR